MLSDPLKSDQRKDVWDKAQVLAAYVVPLLAIAVAYLWVERRSLENEADMACMQKLEHAITELDAGMPVQRVQAYLEEAKCQFEIDALTVRLSLTSLNAKLTQLDGRLDAFLSGVAGSKLQKIPLCTFAWDEAVQTHLDHATEFWATASKDLNALSREYLSQAHRDPAFSARLGAAERSLQDVAQDIELARQTRRLLRLTCDP